MEDYKMKTTTKLLALVLTLPLLAGCGKVKEPKFKNFGDKVSFEDFFGGYQLRMTELEFGKEDALGSKELKIVMNVNNVDETKRSGESILKVEQKGKNTTLNQYDASSKVFRSDEKTDYLITAKAPAGKQKLVLKSDEEKYVQSYTDGGQEYAITVTPKENGFKQKYKVTELMSYDKYIDMYAKDTLGYGLINYFSMSVAKYQSASDEEKEKFSFFKNENIYSLTYSTSKTGEEVMGGSEVVASRSTDYQLKVQVDLGDDLTTAYFEDTHKVTTYQKEYENYRRPHKGICLYDK